MEKKVEVQAKLPKAASGHIPISHVFYAMAFVYMVKSAGAVTFGNIALRYYNIIAAHFSQNGCQRVDVVCD